MKSTVRAVFALLSAVLLGLAAWVAWQGTFTVHGRFLQPYERTSVGDAALWWAASLACMGVGLLGPVLLRRPGAVGWWMGVSMLAAVMLPITHAYLAG